MWDSVGCQEIDQYPFQAFLPIEVKVQRFAIVSGAGET
jgi:hypothetical protein